MESRDFPCLIPWFILRSKMKKSAGIYGIPIRQIRLQDTFSGWHSLMHVTYKKLTDILDVIKSVNRSIDSDTLRCSVLDAFSKCFCAEQSVFILQEGQNRFPDFMLRNLDAKKCSEYKEYFYLLDPFKQFAGSAGKGRLLAGPFPDRDVVTLRDLVQYPSFLSTEFYNDFYRPQHIFWELGAFLKSSNRVLGYIGLFRPQGARDFSREEIRLIGAASPYITLAIEHLEILSKAKIEGIVFDLLERQSTSGLILCDESLRVHYMNHRAGDYCRDLKGGRVSTSDPESSVPGILLEDCRILKDMLKNSSSGLLPLPRKRIVSNRSVSYNVHSQYLEKDLPSGGKHLFVIQVNPVRTQMSLDEERIGTLFRLTNREKEILRFIFEGRKNVQIADTLYISEVTVKKHIQNICKKLHVHNRTALVHKVLKGMNIL